ncbi:MAG: TIGR04282 family arsenosugar biosynthesis glycosyltransferase [Pyrinomonadaceae bacterium]
MKSFYPILNPVSSLTTSSLSSPVPAGSCALAVMIKAPRAGASKTRLVPPLSPIEAAALSVCFLRDTTNNIAGVAAEGGASGIAVYTPAGAEAAFDGLLPGNFSLLLQRGEAFGDRLFYAAEDLLSVGYESLCLIDSDSPTLSPALLAAAVYSLSRPGDRMVIGPSDDGGYYLIGLKKAHKNLFTNIEWSTAQVLSQTIERAAEINLEVEVLPAWYDVDEALTLQRLCDEIFSTPNNHDGREAGYSAPHTRRFLAELIEAEGRERIWPESVGARAKTV